MTIDEMIEVLQAHKAGKTIEIRYKGPDGAWSEGVENVGWSFQSYDYRVKREPTVWNVPIGVQVTFTNNGQMFYETTTTFHNRQYIKMIEIVK